MGCKLHSCKLATKCGMLLFFPDQAPHVGSLATSQTFLLILASFLHSTSHSAHTIVYMIPPQVLKYFFKCFQLASYPGSLPACTMRLLLYDIKVLIEHFKALLSTSKGHGTIFDSIATVENVNKLKKVHHTMSFH